MLIFESKISNVHLLLFRHSNYIVIFCEWNPLTIFSPITSGDETVNGALDNEALRERPTHVTQSASDDGKSPK